MAIAVPNELYNIAAPNVAIAAPNELYNIAAAAESRERGKARV